MILGCTYGIALSSPKDRSDRNGIFGASMTQCTTLCDGASHSRESFYECFGHEKEESPVIDMRYENGKVSVRTKDGCDHALTVGTFAPIFAFFKEINA